MLANAPLKKPPQGQIWSIRLVLGLIVLYIVTFGVLATRRHLAFETGTFDLGNYDQALWNAANGRGLALTTVPNLSLNRMGFHVEPILFLIVPFYWLWPSPLWLLWLQTIALGAAAWPLFLLARRRLTQPGFAVAVVLAYLLLPTTQSINLFDFHAVALSPFFMLWAICFLDKGLVISGRQAGFWPFSPRLTNPWQALPAAAAKYAWLWMALFLCLAMATKEDVPLHVMMLGLYTGLLLKRARLGGVLLGTGLSWAIIAFMMIIPAYRVGGDQSPYVAYFPSLGATPLEIALSPLLRPMAVWNVLITPNNLAALRMLTLPFASINLLGLPILILAAPTLAISLLSNNPLQQQFETWHYAAPLLPFVALATADGLGRLNHWLPYRVREIGLVAIVLILVSSGYHYWRGYSPLSKPFHWPQPTPHHQLGRDIAAAMPPEANLVVQAELGPHFTHRENIQVWTGSLPKQTDYVILDVSHPKFWNNDNAHANFISAMVYQDQFGLVQTKDGYLVLERGAPPKPTQVGFQDFLFADPNQANQPALATFDDWLSLVGVETHTWRETEPQVTLTFQVMKAPKSDYFLHLYLLNAQGETVGATQFQQPVLVWWPTHLWQTGDLIKVRFNSLTWWTGDGNQNEFSYALAVTREDLPWELDARLMVTGPNALPAHLAYVATFERLAGMVYSTTARPTSLAGIVQ